jgi:hypothetical protein
MLRTESLIRVHSATTHHAYATFPFRVKEGAFALKGSPLVNQWVFEVTLRGLFFTRQPDAFVGLEMDTPVGNVKWSIGEQITYRSDHSGMVG